MFQVRIAEVAIAVGHEAAHRQAHVFLQLGAAGFARLARPLFHGDRVHARADRGAHRHRLAHAEKDLHRGFGGVARALQLVEENVALGGRRGAYLAAHHLVDGRFAEGCKSDVRRHHPLAQIAGQECLRLFHGGRVQMVGERLQRGSLEHVDAKSAHRGGGHRGELGSRTALRSYRPRTIDGYAPASRPRKRELARALRRPGISSPPCRYRRSIRRLGRWPPRTSITPNESCVNSG